MDNPKQSGSPQPNATSHYGLFDLLTNQVHNGLWDWDIEHNRLYLSPSWKQTLGFSDAEIPNRFDSFEYLLHPDDAERVINGLMTCIEGSETHYHDEYRMQRRDGTFCWVWLRAYVLRDADGKAQRMVATHTDVTRWHQQEQNERTQRHYIQTLYEISRILNLTLETDQVLDLVVTQVSKLLPHDAAILVQVAGSSGRITHYHLPPFGGQLMRVASPPTLHLADVQAYSSMLTHQRPLRISHLSVQHDLPKLVPPPVLQTLLHYTGSQCSYLGTPIFLDGHIAAILNLISWREGFFTQADQERLQAFAEQASFGLHRARLYTQSYEGAQMHERQRIAADLHDTLSQTLFSANMIAQTLPRVWAKDRAQGEQYLNDLHNLTRSALAEMRSLLVELRPEMLLESDLETLLRQLCEATQQRIAASIQFTSVGTSRTLPDAVQVALYRIAQEALNNTVKHANARLISVRLEWTQLQVGVLVADDGIGFDYQPHERSATHFGIEIMKQRAMQIGAYLHIHSRVQVGTQIRLTWVTPQQQPDGGIKTNP